MQGNAKKKNNYTKSCHLELILLHFKYMLFRLYCMQINHIEQNWDAIYYMFHNNLFLKIYYVVIIFPCQEIQI